MHHVVAGLGMLGAREGRRPVGFILETLVVSSFYADAGPLEMKRVSCPGNGSIMKRCA